MRNHITPRKSKMQSASTNASMKNPLILYGGGRYISPTDVNPSVGRENPFNKYKATQTRQASFFVSCHRAPISSGNARPESMVALVGQSSDWPVSLYAGFLTPISVTTLYERENSGGDSLNQYEEAAIMATTPTQTHPQPVKKSLPVRSTWLYILSVAQHRATGFDSPNTDADSRNHSVMRSFCVRSKPITPSGARIMVGRGGEAFAPAGFICAGLSTLPRPATLFDSREQVVKPTDEAAIMATTPTQLHPELPKFTFHFLAVRRADPCAKPHRTSVIAPNEREARQLLARDFVLLFAGRVPAQGVRHG